MFYLVSCGYRVLQPLRYPVLNRPTPKTATASPWSSQRFPGQPATSWGRSQKISSRRQWWAAPRVPWCSSSPTQATNWASCLSILGGGASPHPPSRPGQVRKKCPKCPKTLNSQKLIQHVSVFTMKRNIFMSDKLLDEMEKTPLSLQTRYVRSSPLQLCRKSEM